MLNGNGKTLGYRGGISSFKERTDVLGGKSFFWCCYDDNARTLSVAVTVFFSPRVLGVGHDIMNDILQEDFQSSMSFLIG